MPPLLYCAAPALLFFFLAFFAFTISAVCASGGAGRGGGTRGQRRRKVVPTASWRPLARSEDITHSPQVREGWTILLPEAPARGGAEHERQGQTERKHGNHRAQRHETHHLAEYAIRSGARHCILFPGESASSKDEGNGWRRRQRCGGGGGREGMDARLRCALRCIQGEVPRQDVTGKKNPTCTKG